MNKLITASALAAALAAFAVGSVQAQSKPIVYPAKGQSAQQQQKDDGECYGWAKSSTGIDPAAVAAQPAPPPPPAGGERARGAARGAVGGAAIGAVAGDAGKGAAAGAVVGTMAGGAKSRQNQKAQQSQQANAQAQQQGAMDTYNRAHAACMEGRGYTIK